MATQCDQSQISDIPLPFSSTQNPTGADLPRKLIVLDGDWEPSTDPSILAGIDYLAVSYRQHDFPKKAPLEKMVRKICTRKHIEAYWIDFACIGETPDEKNEDLYRIADVFRNAKMTLIVIKGEDNQPFSEGWVSWGMRIWTFPEALLSENFIVQVGLENLLVKEMTLKQVANHAYGVGNEKERMLVQLYGNKGKDFSEVPERLEMLCEAIWGRQSGSDSSVAQSSSELTAYPGEKVYALMGFLLHRIPPKLTESEDDAFKRLLDANELQCDRYPRSAYGSNGIRKLGIRNKKNNPEKEVDDVELPEHVAEAKFDYGKTVRTICEKGTREEILDEVYNWLGLGSNNPVSHTRDKVILWLNGLAGSGKSTIAQTAARRCDDEGILGGTFFCSQDSAVCSDVLNIFATIAYELGRFNAHFRRRLSEIFSNDKDLQQAQPERQLQKLIVEPLRSVPNMPRYVVIIDALNECSDDNARSVILEALNQHRDDLAPLKFLITSRPTQNIKGAFLTFSLSEDTQNFDLNKVDSKQTRRDIYTFLNKRLSDLALARGLKAWPSTKEIDALVELSNGLFIFASMTVNFLSSKSAASMKDQLETLLSSKAPVSDSPYKHLDILYLQVFETAFGKISDKLKYRLQIVMGSLVLSRRHFSIASLGDFLRMSVEDILETLRSLHSLVVVPENDNERIRLIHPSIHDFLTDENRCTDSRFVVNKEVGHSSIAKCCFRTLARFAESEEVQTFLQAPTRRKLKLLKKSIEENDHSAIKYSFFYWSNHLYYSNLEEDAMKGLNELVSNQSKYLLTKYPKSAAEALLERIAKLPQWPSPSSEYPLLLYQTAVFLLGEKWSSIRYELFKNSWNVLESEYGYKKLNEESAKLEVVIVILINFIPIIDVPEIFATIHQLKRAAKELHNKILQQTIPEDEKLHSDLLALMDKLSQQLSKEAKSVRYLDSDFDDYARKLDGYFSGLLYLMEAFNKIFDHILNNDLDSFLTKIYAKMFSTADHNDMQMDVFRAILTVSLLGPKKLMFADMEGLQSLFYLPKDEFYTSLSAMSIFAGALVDGIMQVQSIYPMLFSTFFDSVKCLDFRFFIDPIVEHSKIALRCLEKLIEFVSTQEMQSYQTDPTYKKRMTFRKYLQGRNDAALTYAYLYWASHIDKSDRQLDTSVLRLLDTLILRLLGKLVSQQHAIYVVIKNDVETISMLFNLINKHLYQPSTPSDIITELYKAIILLCTWHWPEYRDYIETNYVEKINYTRTTLIKNFSYKDGLYDLDPNFPFLLITLFYLAGYFPKYDILELKSDIHKLRSCANEVHKLIMRHAVSEDESVCSVLRKHMSILYQKLSSTYGRYDANRRANGNGQENAYILSTALSDWIKNLTEFQFEIHRILGKLDNIDSSESSFAIAIIGVPEPNELQMSVTISELSKKDEDTSFSNVNEYTSSVASSHPSSRSAALPRAVNQPATHLKNASESLSPNNPVRPPVVGVRSPNIGNSAVEGLHSTGAQPSNEIVRNRRMG